MDDNKVKEIISEAFFSLVLAKNRFKSYKSSSGDDGVDLLINPIITRVRTYGGGTSRIDSPKKIDIQLKCTTENKVTVLPNGNLRYYLKVKNYEDLLVRRDEKGVPLALIVFVLPDKEDDWLEIFHDQLLLRRCGYWYVMPDTESLVRSEVLKSKSNISIEILSKNKLTLDFKTIFDKIWK
ncbi:MAG: DUF4365 domain-containing protein [Bacteroidota bacterium]